MVRVGSRYALVVVTMGVILLMGLSWAQAAKEDFRTVFNTDVNTDEERNRCVNSTGVDVEALSSARATLRIIQFHGKTWLSIHVRNGAPNTLHTVWLKLAGSSSLTGAGVTALAKPSAIDALADVTPMTNLVGGPLVGRGDDGTGTHELDVVVNGFVTDKHGRGKLILYLDFPIKKGAYQLQEFDPDLAPVAIGNTPFTLRIASHCADGVGHGLVPGMHERWFDWP